MLDFQIGELLGKTVEEIRALPNAEVLGWAAYIRLRAEKDELAQKRRRR